MREELNGRPLCVKLDCRTRWYPTYVMIERALQIIPASKNVLSRRGTPIDSTNALALQKIVEILEPFKRAVLVMCRDAASLLHADRVLKFLLSALRENRSDLAQTLREELELEIRKRRIVMSSVCTSNSYNKNPQYEFNLESLLEYAIHRTVKYLMYSAKSLMPMKIQSRTAPRWKRR